MTKKESTTFHPFYTRGAGSIFERKQAFRVGELMARCKVAVQAEERGKKKKKDKKGQREAGTAQSSLKCRSSCRRFFPPCASSATSRVAPGINIVMRIMPKSRHGHRAPATATLKRHRCFMRWVTFCPNEITLPESPTVHGFLVKYRAAFLRTYAGVRARVRHQRVPLKRSMATNPVRRPRRWSRRTRPPSSSPTAFWLPLVSAASAATVKAGGESG